MIARVPTVCCVVEGHGEVAALPILVRRIAAELFQVGVVVPPPHRLSRGKILKTDELRRTVRFQADRAGEHGGVLVLTDADDDRPDELAHRVGVMIDSGAAPRTEIVIAVREYEAWFLAAVASLRSHASMDDAATFDGDPESPRDAKGHLERMMKERYRETIHQPAFSGLIDLDAARRGSPSFSVLVDAVTTLLARG